MDKEAEKTHVTTERTPLGEEIEAALGEVLAHAWGDETVLPCRVVDDRAAESNTRRSAMTQTSEGGSMTIRDGVIHSRKDTMGGTPVFKGTRVVVKNLFDYLAGGHSLDEFLDDFPSVSREQAIRVLDMAREVLEQIAYETAPQ